MKPWIFRNAAPIGLVLLASALVVGAFEGVDLFVADTPTGAEEGEVELAGVASLAGLIKVSAFLGVGALAAIPLRRRFRTDAGGTDT